MLLLQEAEVRVQRDPAAGIPLGFGGTVASEVEAPITLERYEVGETCCKAAMRPTPRSLRAPTQPRAQRTGSIRSSASGDSIDSATPFPACSQPRRAFCSRAGGPGARMIASNAALAARYWPPESRSSACCSSSTACGEKYLSLWCSPPYNPPYNKII